MFFSKKLSHKEKRREQLNKTLDKHFNSKPLDKILKILHPHKPKKFILGSHYIKNSMINWDKQGGRGYLPNGKYSYKNIPIEKVEDKYYIDFII